MEIKKCRTVCPYDCPDSCGIIAETDGLRVLGVQGDNEHPVTKGFLCRKMQNYEKDINSPHRILKPLKRVGKKGSGEFKEIPWAEAVNEICSRWKQIINEFGSEAILPYSYAGTMGLVQRNCGEAFFACLGASNLKRTICSSAKGAGYSMVMGASQDYDSSHLVHSDFIVLWGSNPKVNRLHIMPYLNEAKKNGAKIVFIETYKNISTSMGDEILLIQPGTDSLLILAMLNYLDKNGLIDQTFIDKYTTGYDMLKENFKKYSVEDACRITGIGQDQFVRFCNEYAKAQKPMILAGSGMSRHTNGAEAVRLLLCLPAVIGAWARGGGTAGFGGAGGAFDVSLVKRPDFIDQSQRTINMNQLGDALLDVQNPPIKSFYVYHSNPAVMTPDQTRVLRGLERDDLFTVVHDRYLTDTAMYADIVLPATFSVEQDDVSYAYGHYHIQRSLKAVEPQGESKSNWNTFCALAEGMGFEDDYFKKTENEMVEELIAKPNKLRDQLTEEEKERFLKGYGVKISQPDVMRFKTKDGKINFCNPSVNPPTPDYNESKDHKYPLRLVMVHCIHSLNSNFSYRDELMESRGMIALKISIRDAQKRHIENGSLMKAYNDYGSITVKACVTEDVPEGTAIADGVFQKKFTYGDGNFNSLLSEELTDAGEASTLNSCTIEIERI